MHRGGAACFSRSARSGELTDTYYCASCRTNSGLISPAAPMSGWLTPYQQSRFGKHTAPTRSYPDNSVFDSSDPATYFARHSTAVNSGDLKIDASGRRNLVLATDKQIGTRDQSGAAPVQCNGWLVALPELSGYAHMYPIPIAPGAQVCAGCGQRIPRPLSV